MPTVHVNLADRSYDILVEDGLLERAGELILSAERPITRTNS